MLLLLVLICRPESRFLELIPREESEDSESAVPRLILRRQNTPSDDSTPPKVKLMLFEINFLIQSNPLLQPPQ